jgi:hypothetical protein
MAHAFAGDLGDHACIVTESGTMRARLTHFEAWREKLRKRMRHGFSYVPGAIFHLWHGSKENRQHTKCREILSRNDFDPALDIEKIVM